MQINPISSASFEGKKSDLKRVVITPEMFANMDDRQLGVLAQGLASEKVNDKKHRKLNNIMYNNLPLAGGLAALATTAKASRLGKLGAFAGGAFAWAGGLLAADLLIGGKHALEKRSSKLREFNKNHPIVSTVGTIAGVFAGMMAGGRGLAKLADKVLPKLQNTKIYQKAAGVAVRAAGKLGKALDGSKILNGASKLVGKVPSSIKSFGKTLAVNAPLMLVIGQLGHAFNHKVAKEKVTLDAFAQLKEAQETVREKLVNDELADKLAAEEA